MNDELMMKLEEFLKIYPFLNSHGVYSAIHHSSFIIIKVHNYNGVKRSETE